MPAHMGRPKYNIQIKAKKKDHKSPHIGLAKKMQVLALMRCGATLKEAARQTEVSYHKVMRWSITDPTFKLVEKWYAGDHNAWLAHSFPTGKTPIGLALQHEIAMLKLSPPMKERKPGPWLINKMKGEE